MSGAEINGADTSGTDNAVCAVILAAGYSSRMGGSPKALLPLGGSTMLGLAVRSLRAAGVRRIRVVTGHEPVAVGAEALAHGAKPVYNPDFAQGMFSSLCTGLLDLTLEEEAGGDAVGAVFLLPVDAALVRPQSVAGIIRAWLSLPPEARDQAVLLPSFAGRSGHPPLIGAAHISPILLWQGDGQWQNQWQWRGGLRDYLGSLLRTEAAAAFSLGRVHGTCLCAPAEVPGPGAAPLSSPTPAKTGAVVCFLSLPDAGVLADIDTPHEYEQARSFLEQSRDRSRPLPEEAWEWLRHAGLGSEKIRHSLKVAQGALRLSMALQDAGHTADPVLAVCGGLLHDIARNQKNHAREAQRLLQDQGWFECALVVGAHTVLPDPLLAALGLPLRDLPVGEGDSAAFSRDWEALCATAGANPEAAHGGASRSRTPLCRALLHACAAVYMADKYYYGDRQVSLAERFSLVRGRFSENAGAVASVDHRERIAGAVRDWFHTACGSHPETVIAAPCAHSLEEFLAPRLEEILA